MLNGNSYKYPKRRPATTLSQHIVELEIGIEKNI